MKLMMSVSDIHVYRRYPTCVLNHRSNIKTSLDLHIIKVQFTALFTKPPVSRFTVVLNQNIRLRMRVHAKRTEPADAKSQCRRQRSRTRSLVCKKTTLYRTTSWGRSVRRLCIVLCSYWMDFTL